MDDLIRVFRYWFEVEDLPMILIIDEVDSAANNQVFLVFLAQLRSLFLKRQKAGGLKTFQSVISYTSGYPYLVSRICQLVDVQSTKKSGLISEAWTRAGVDCAVKIANRIFETLLYNLFLSEKEIRTSKFALEGDLSNIWPFER